MQCKIWALLLKIPQNGGHSKLKNHIFALFSQSYFPISNETWDSARGKGHLVRKFGLKQPWPREMVAIFMVLNYDFALFSNSILVIPTKPGRDIARNKGHLVRECDLKRPWPRKMVAILMVWNQIFALFSQSILVIPTKLGRAIARSKRHLVCEFDLKLPWLQEMVAIFRVWSHILVIPNETW